MTAHDLHDALNLLPGDLITATDRLRGVPKIRVIHWKRWVSLAACLVLVLSTAMVFGQRLLPFKGGSTESAAQSPAAAAPMERDDVLTDTAAAAEEAAPEAQEAPVSGNGSMSQTTDEKAAEEELCIDHSHRFAEPGEESGSTAAYCGNMLTTVYLEKMNFTLAGSDSVRLTHILTNLPYDPNEVCRCMAEFTVDTEMCSGIEVNLTEGFARCEQGQAALTEEQAETIRTIIENLQ